MAVACVDRLKSCDIERNIVLVYKRTLFFNLMFHRCNWNFHWQILKLFLTLQIMKVFMISLEI